MGGTKPTAPQVIMPSPASPTVFQTVVPLKSYKDLAAQLGRFQTELGKVQEQRYSEVGTPAQIGAAQQARNVKSEEAYLASLPKGDRYMAQTTGVGAGAGTPGAASPGIQPGTTALDVAKSLSAKALERIDEVPTPTITSMPEWAQGTLQYKKIGTGDKATYEEIPSEYSSFVADTTSGTTPGGDKDRDDGGSRSSKGFLNNYSKNRFIPGSSKTA